MTVLKQVFATFVVMWTVTAAAQAAAAGSKLSLTPGESCKSSSCHADLGEKPYVHLVAVDGNTCTICHLVPDPTRHSFQLLAEGGELCETCHGNMTPGQYKHVPVAVRLCTFCHDPHQADHPKQLRQPASAELCFNCHDRNAFIRTVEHGPVNKGECLKCHDPHTSEYPAQTLAAVPELCFGCHDKNLKDDSGRQLPSPKQTFDNTGLTQHLPFGSGECLMCHNPHGSENHRMLKASYPESFYTSYASDKYICFTCHDEQAFSEPRTTTATGFRNGNLNLHHRHVNRKKGRTCRACHHHHGAENAKLIREKVPFGNRYITIEDFELTETGGKCGPTCHPVVRYDRVEAVQNVLKVTPRQGNDAAPGTLPGTGQEQRNQ